MKLDGEECRISCIMERKSTVHVTGSNGGVGRRGALKDEQVLSRPCQHDGGA